ncbi:hypothetical protein K443DRAFT_685536 [Laccaria amethystina LaAM-08-1]|uniref:Uncharacterized protein n=1 Tax=Laccaria amethystina LaAM-08-1 TaxID=1095629 RepID=A0A0C9X6D8_9AGAR|nr:hypothetical protein K443DRAFT_685536 [Laccaria amethystina LaAM-08-1]
MQVDSLRSKKVVDEGISDIKPNKHHDSSEDDKDLGNEGHSLLKGRKARSYLSASSVPLLLHNSLPSGSQGGRPIISNDGPTNQPSYSLNSNTQPNEAFFWPSAPNEFDAVNLGPAVQLQYNNEVLLQPHTPSSQSLRDLSAYPRTQSYPQTPPQIPTYTETSPIPKKRLYSYREQLNFFLQAEDLPTRTYGPFIPQPMYQPHTSSGWGRYMEEKIELEAPIYFSIDHPSEFGILLSDALHSRFNRLHNRDQLVFEGRGPSISIRLEWPGYRQWIWQIPTEDFRSPPGPITLSKLAEKVAECIQRFIEERKNQSPKDKSWKVGTGANHIKLEDLVLVSIHHVSLGSWQPQLRLKHQLPPWRG